MACLLDVNLLIALCDERHSHHPVAVRWWNERDTGWATCPITELGLLRIYGNPNYPNGPGSPERAARVLQHLRQTPGHTFWPDSLSLMDGTARPSLRGVASRHLTDLYLLALAVQQGGRLVTLDSRIDPALVPGGKRALVVLTRAN